jgi:prepilin-type N-terminal cleavage/methylation domain-containing protein
MRKNGFTLIEMLITVAIFSVVSVAVYSTFSSGLSVWQRAQKTGIAENRDLLRIEKLGRELSGAFAFKDINFIGAKDNLQLPGIVDSDIARITYSFDAGKKILFRSVMRLADILAAKGESKELKSNVSAYLSGVDKLNFSYFYFDIQKNNYAWRDDWGLPSLPLAVKLDITLRNETHTATIFIPRA